MADPYASRSSALAAAPPTVSSSHASPSLPAPMLPSFRGFNTPNPKASSNVNPSSTKLPSIPPISSLPSSSTGNKLPPSSQLSSHNDQAVRSSPFDSQHPAQASPQQRSSSLPASRDHSASPQPFPRTNVSLASHLNPVDSLPRMPSPSTLNPLHPTRQNQPFPGSSRTSFLPLPHPVPLRSPGDHPRLEPQLPASSNLLPSPQIPSDSHSIRFGPSLGPITPFALPPLPSISDTLNSNRNSPSPGAPPHAHQLPQPSYPSQDLRTSPQMLSRQQHSSLPGRPIMLAGPRASAVMQNMPKFQRGPLVPHLPLSSNSPQQSLSSPHQAKPDHVTPLPYCLPDGSIHMYDTKLAHPQLRPQQYWVAPPVSNLQSLPHHIPPLSQPPHHQPQAPSDRTTSPLPVDPTRPTVNAQSVPQSVPQSVSNADVTPSASLPRPLSNPDGTFHSHPPKYPHDTSQSQPGSQHHRQHRPSHPHAAAISLPQSPVLSPRLPHPRPDSVNSSQPISRPLDDKMQPRSVRSPKNESLHLHGPRVSQSPPVFSSASPARLHGKEHSGGEPQLHLPESINQNDCPPRHGAPTSGIVASTGTLSSGKPDFMNGRESFGTLTHSQSRNPRSLEVRTTPELRGGIKKSFRNQVERESGYHTSPKPENLHFSSDAAEHASLKSTKPKSRKPRFPSESDVIRDSETDEMNGRLGKPLSLVKRQSEFHTQILNQEPLRSEDKAVPSAVVLQRLDGSGKHDQDKMARNGLVSQPKGNSQPEANETSIAIASDSASAGQLARGLSSAVPMETPGSVENKSVQTVREKPVRGLGKDAIQEMSSTPGNPSNRSQDLRREARSNERAADARNAVDASPQKSPGRLPGQVKHSTGQNSIGQAQHPRTWDARTSDATSHSARKPDGGVSGSAAMHENTKHQSTPGWKSQPDLDDKTTVAHANPDIGQAQSNRVSSGTMWATGVLSSAPKPHLPPLAVQSRSQVRPFVSQAAHAQTQSSYSQNSNIVSNALSGPTSNSVNDQEKIATYAQTTTTHSNPMGKAHRESSTKRDVHAEKPMPKVPGPPSNHSLGAESLVINHDSTSMRSGDGAIVPSLHTLPSGSQPPGYNRNDSADQGVGSQRRPLKVEDALAYLEKVKSQFSEKVFVYNKFLDIMKDFKAQAIDTTEVIKRVSVLFSGHEDLILGFNTFLPPGYKIEVRENRDTGAFNAGFVGPHGQYNELEVIKRPGSSKPLQPRARAGKKQPTPPPIRPKDVKGENVKGGNVKGESAKGGNLKGENVIAAQSSVIPVSEVIGLPPKEPSRQSGASPSDMNAKPLPAVVSKGTIPSQQTGPGPEDERSNHPSQVLTKHAAPQQPLKKTESHQNKSEELEQAIGFITTIRSRLSDKPDAYNQFISALHHYRIEQTSIREIFSSVAKLLGPHKDLLSQFEQFIPGLGKPTVAEVSKANLQKHRPPPEITRSHAAPASRDVSAIRYDEELRKKHRSRDMRFFEKFKALLGPRKTHLYTEFIKCLSLASQGIVTQDELLGLTSEILHNAPDAQRAFVSYLEGMGDGDDGDSGGNGSSPTPNKDLPIDPERLNYFRSKPMSEVASESGYDAIFSYRRMPKDFPKCTHAGRSSMEKRVLNDIWVNVTTGSEDYAFVRKNANEDNLFRAEDDRYELDMVISTNQATILKLEAVISTMSRLPPSEKKCHALAPGVLSPIHFNAIRRIYGSHGDEMISQVKVNPSNAVDLVLKRLKQKDEEWRKVRSTMHRIWREVGERNYHKSLDHRSAFFKVVDKKDLGLKNLLTDIMDPAGSMTSRDSEMTRVRTYAIPKGAGGSADWSGAVTAVSAAAKIPAGLAPKTLELKFERSDIHRAALDLIRNVAADDSSPEVKRCVEEFEKLLANFFSVNLVRGTSKGQKYCKGVGRGKVSNEMKMQPMDIRNDSDSTRRTDRTDFDVLYGDEAIYLVMRLYHLLYERVLNAWLLSNEQVDEKLRRQKLNLCASLRNTELVRTEHIVKPRIMKVGIGQELSANGFTLCPESDKATEIFEQFLGIALPFIRGKLECSKYEEQCRMLLGTKSYCVFTLDKLMLRLMKQIGVVFCSDVASKELVSLYIKCKDNRKQGEQKVNSSPEGLQEVYCIAASRHLAETRGPGSHLMRFSRDYCELRNEEVDISELKVGLLRSEAEQRRHKAIDKVGCLLTIEVIGKTGDDEHAQLERARQNMVDTLLGFCGSFGDKSSRGSGKTGSEGRRRDSEVNSGGRDWRKDGKRSHEEDARTDRNRAKKRKMYGSELLRFRGSQEDMIRRAKAVVSKNNLVFYLNANGVMHFAGGSEEVMFVRSRKRKWSGSVDQRRWNERSLTTHRMRKKFKLDQRIGTSREGRHGTRS